MEAIKKLFKNAEFIASSVFLFGLILAAHFKIPTPIDDLSISLQTVVVGMIGFVFSTRNATYILLAYAVLGWIGLDVFSAIEPGFTFYFDPYFGFLIGFMLVPLYLRLLKQKFSSKRLLNLFFIYVGMHLVIIVPGILRMEYPTYEFNSIKMIIASLLPAAIIKSVLLSLLDFVFQKQIKHLPNHS